MSPTLSTENLNSVSCIYIFYDSFVYIQDEAEFKDAVCIKDSVVLYLDILKKSV